jgi:hypothetical protein
MRFIITTHAGLDGARLSLSGQWGNLPFASIAAAEARAREVARGKPYTVELNALMRRAIPH